MSLKKIALITLIVVMLLGSVVFYGCKAKPQEEVATDTIMTEAPVVDTMAAPVAEPAPEAPATK